MSRQRSEEKRLLLETGPRRRRQHTARWISLLTWTCWEPLSLLPAARILVKDTGADPNVNNHDGATALTWSPNFEFFESLDFPRCYGFHGECTHNPDPPVGNLLQNPEVTKMANRTPEELEALEELEQFFRDLVRDLLGMSLRSEE